jgi:hypothetical protein
VATGSKRHTVAAVTDERRGRVWIAPATQIQIPAGMWVDPATTIFSASWQYIPDDAPADAGAELLGAEDIAGAAPRRRSRGAASLRESS